MLIVNENYIKPKPPKNKYKNNNSWFSESPARIYAMPESPTKKVIVLFLPK